MTLVQNIRFGRARNPATMAYVLPGQKARTMFLNQDLFAFVEEKDSEIRGLPKLISHETLHTVVREFDPEASHGLDSPLIRGVFETQDITGLSFGLTPRKRKRS